MSLTEKSDGLQHLLGSNAIERICSIVIVGLFMAIAIWLTTDRNGSLPVLLSSLNPWSAEGKYNDVRWLTRGLIAAIVARIYLGAFLRWIFVGKTSR